MDTPASLRPRGVARRLSASTRHRPPPRAAHAPPRRNFFRAPSQVGRAYSDDFPAIPQGGEKWTLRLYDRLLLSGCPHISSHCATGPSGAVQRARYVPAPAPQQLPEDGDTVLHECRQCSQQNTRCTPQCAHRRPSDAPRWHQRERQRHRLDMMQQFLHLTRLLLTQLKRQHQPVRLQATARTRSSAKKPSRV